MGPKSDNLNNQIRETILSKSVKKVALPCGSHERVSRPRKTVDPWITRNCN